MPFATIDWVVIAASIVVSFLPALFYARRAGSSTAEFFTSGRAAPWWLVGVSMVATTFSTDTPNLVTNMVRENGVADNWLWWSFLLTGMATVFFYARMWRRSGVLTDLEFYELRYSGKAASFVRGFRAVYLGLFFNCVIMATVNLAAAKIGNIVLGWPMGKTLALCSSITDLLRVGVRPVGRPRHRRDPVRHHDDGHVRGRLLRRAGSREVGGLAGLCDSTNPRDARPPAGLLRLGPRADGLPDPADGAVVVGLVPGRRAGRRQLHRAADARVAHARRTR